MPPALSAPDAWSAPSLDWALDHGVWGGRTTPQHSHGARLRVAAERQADRGAFALLIRLATPDVDDQPVGAPVDVLDVERHQLRAAERASEPDDE
jgi:hypothetical protein